MGNPISSSAPPTSLVLSRKLTPFLNVRKTCAFDVDRDTNAFPQFTDLVKETTASLQFIVLDNETSAFPQFIVHVKETRVFLNSLFMSRKIQMLFLS
jgi:hypothetical protein